MPPQPSHRVQQIVLELRQGECIDRNKASRPCPLCGRIGSRGYDDLRHLDSQMHYKNCPLRCPLAGSSCAVCDYPSLRALLRHLYSHEELGQGEQLRDAWNRLKQKFNKPQYPRPVALFVKNSAPNNSDRSLSEHRSTIMKPSRQYEAFALPPLQTQNFLQLPCLSGAESPSSSSISAPPSPHGVILPSLRDLNLLPPLPPQGYTPDELSRDPKIGESAERLSYASHPSNNRYSPYSRTHHLAASDSPSRMNHADCVNLLPPLHQHSSQPLIQTSTVYTEGPSTMISPANSFKLRPIWTGD